MSGEKTARILRPVALPRKFMGAPMEPAGMNFALCIIAALGCFASKDFALMGIAIMVAMVPIHVAIIWIGFREPHIGSLLGTMHRNFQTARGVGRTRRRYFSAG